MIGFSSYAGVMENLKNSAEEQKPRKQEPSKNQTTKPVGGFVLVHAGKPLNCNQQQCFDYIHNRKKTQLIWFLLEILKSVAFSFCCLHVGAGYHSESKAKEYKHVCKRACQRVCLHDGYLLIIIIFGKFTWKSIVLKSQFCFVCICNKATEKMQAYSEIKFC